MVCFHRWMVPVLGSFIGYTAYCVSGWQRLDMKSVRKESRQMLHTKKKKEPSHRRRYRSDCWYIMVYLSGRILNCCYVWLSWGLEPLNQPLINHLLTFTDEGCVDGKHCHWAACLLCPSMDCRVASVVLEKCIFCLVKLGSQFTLRLDSLQW